MLTSAATWRREEADRAHAQPDQDDPPRPQAVGLNDPQYRTLLRSVAGVESCKALDNPGVEDVMAVLEGMGFDSHPGGPTYWRDKVDRRGSRVNERMVHLIRELAAGGRYDLAAMVGGRAAATGPTSSSSSSRARRGC
jgi:hypothetical protein